MVHVMGDVRMWTCEGGRRCGAVGSVGALTGTCGHGGGHRSALMAGRDHEHASARTSWAGGVAADGVAEQRGHGKGRALSPSPPCAELWCGATCGFAPFPPHRAKVALDPSKGEGTARAATRGAGAEKPGRARTGSRSRWAWACQGPVKPVLNSKFKFEFKK